MLPNLINKVLNLFSPKSPIFCPSTLNIDWLTIPPIEPNFCTQLTFYSQSFDHLDSTRTIPCRFMYYDLLNL